MQIQFGLVTHKDLIDFGEKWLKSPHPGQYRCGVILREYRSYFPEIPDLIGFNHHQSVVIECKVSRADYLVDLKKSHRQGAEQLGNLRYYLALPQVLSVDECNDGWGLLYFSEAKIKLIKVAESHNEPEIRVAEYSLLYSLALRISENGLMPEAMKPYGQLKEAI
ncbi:MAG: hypothetical protein PHW65_03610 [Dehalococcoidales bacterium]|jgi:hypothetical protein|nr:hypothetical protein [Dehalococcoidales bacterium]